MFRGAHARPGGAAHAPRRAGPHVARPYENDILLPMTTTNLDTDQAARDSSGAHPHGRYLDEFEVGATYKHWPAQTVTEAGGHLFRLLTMHHHPPHITAVYAAASQQG